MAINQGGIKVIAPSWTTAVVGLVKPNGVALTSAFSDASLTTALTLPVSVAAGTTQAIYVQSAGSYSLSVTANNTQVAAWPNRSTLTFDIGPGQVNVFDYSILTIALAATQSTTELLKKGVMGTGMIPAFSNNHCYPVPSSGSLTANGGVMSIEARVATTDMTEVRMIIANRYFTSVEPVESDGPNTVIQRHALAYPWGILKYISGSTAWLSSTAFVVGDVCTLSGNSYVCTTAHTNHTPVVGGNTWWDQVGFYPLHFPGEGANRDVTLQPGQHLISDPVAIDVKAGTKIAVRSMVQPNNGTANTGSYPTGFALQAFGGDYYINASTGAAPAADWTLADPTTTATQSSSQTSGGGVLVGKPAIVTGSRLYLGCIGDSLIAGSGDGTLFGNNEPGGWFVRAVNRAYPYIRAAHTGDTLSGYLRSGTSQHRRSFIGDCDVYLSEMATNDMNLTLAQLQALKLAEWAYWKNRGALVVQVLMQPRTTSSDSWATTTNQTDVATGFSPAGTSLRDQLNAWYLTKPAGCDYVLDFLSTIETAPSSNRWRNVGNGDAQAYTTDGTHPNNYACLQIVTVAQPFLQNVMNAVGL